LQQQSQIQFQQTQYEQSLSQQRGVGQTCMPPMQQYMSQPIYHGQPPIPSSRYTTLSWDTAHTSDIGISNDSTQTAPTQQPRQAETQSSLIQMLDLPTTVSATSVTRPESIQQDPTFCVINTQMQIKMLNIISFTDKFWNT
jgi:hypothetical protein